MMHTLYETSRHVRSEPRPSPVPSRAKPAPRPSSPAWLSDRYHLGRVIGRGAEGVVHLGFQEPGHREVAIKMLSKETAQDPKAVARFEREARLAGELNNPALVCIHDFDYTDDGRPYMVMEYLRGETMASRLYRLGPRPPAEIVMFARQLVWGLAALHDRAVIHCDLKPENIIVTGEDEPVAKIVDFGLAQPTFTEAEENMVCGTPTYMAPEQALGSTIDPRTDVYGLSTVMYELLTGNAPFMQDDQRALLVQKVLKDPPPMNLHRAPRLERLVMAGLSREPRGRPGSARAFLLELAAC